jgi:2-(1,2-epoxy-1,2-dihydrophenyl)acetyl-CoA isomerase
MASEFILTETSAGVLSITLNRPGVLNSVTAAMSAELLATLNRASDDDQVRAVLLTGAGRGFCAGQDLAEATPAPDKPRQDFAAHVRKVYNPVVRSLRRMPKPVIAAVNGVAAGAGASLAFACDFIFASRQASFIQAFAKIGLVPDTGATFFLPRLVGTARATAMMMLGEKVTAEQALNYGMIYRVVEPDRLLEESRAFAAALATQATFALGLTKRLINSSAANDLDAQLEAEADLQGTAGRSDDFQEGVAAFLGKRPPRFEGR